MEKSKDFIRQFQDKKANCVKTYIGKYPTTVDKAEKEKINKIKIKESLDKFLRDNTGD